MAHSSSTLPINLSPASHPDLDAIKDAIKNAYIPVSSFYLYCPQTGLSQDGPQSSIPVEAPLPAAVQFDIQLNTWEVHMLLSQPQDQSRKQDRDRPLLHRSRLLTGAGLLSLAAIALLTGAAQPGQQPSQNIDKPYLLPEANRLPDANDQMKMRSRDAKQQSFDAANAERKKQLSDDSTKLLTLAMALKAEVDKTNKDMLSLNVIRKADEIERLARNVKEKMKLTVGGS
jgi:hypothetical protein